MDTAKRIEFAIKLLDFINGGKTEKGPETLTEMLFGSNDASPPSASMMTHREVQAAYDRLPPYSEIAPPVPVKRRLIRPTSLKEQIRRKRAMVDAIVAECRVHSEKGPGNPDWQAVAPRVEDVGIKRPDGVAFTAKQIQAAWGAVASENF